MQQATHEVLMMVLSYNSQLCIEMPDKGEA